MLAVAIGAIPDDLFEPLDFDFELLHIEGRQRTAVHADFSARGNLFDLFLLGQIEVREVFVELGVIAE